MLSYGTFIGCCCRHCLNTSLDGILDFQFHVEIKFNGQFNKPLKHILFPYITTNSIQMCKLKDIGNDDHFIEQHVFTLQIYSENVILNAELTIQKNIYIHDLISWKNTHEVKI